MRSAQAAATDWACATEAGTGTAGAALTSCEMGLGAAFFCVAVTLPSRLFRFCALSVVVGVVVVAVVAAADAVFKDALSCDERTLIVMTAVRPSVAIPWLMPCVPAAMRSVTYSTWVWSAKQGAFKLNTYPI